MADIIFYCQFCGASLKVDTKGVGLKVPCPECGKEITIPAPESIPSKQIKPSKLSAQNDSGKTESIKVIVTDFDMSFSSMVYFIVKLVLAAIPATIILVLFWAAIVAFIMAIMAAMK